MVQGHSLEQLLLLEAIRPDAVNTACVVDSCSGDALLN